MRWQARREKLEHALRVIHSTDRSVLEAELFSDDPEVLRR